jgi:hypothetical protein
MKNIIIFILFFISFNAYSQKTIITEFKLKNGWTVRGNIIDSIPNKSYTIRTLKGVEQIYSIEEIDKISKFTFGRDKIDYIPKGKISTNVDFGLMKEQSFISYAGYYNITSNESFIGTSLNYNIINNTEISITYGRIFSEQYGFDYDYNLQRNVDFKRSYNTNLFGLSIKKFFTNFKVKPYLGGELAHSQSDTYSTKLFLPNAGAIYFLNKKIGVSLNYKVIFNLDNPYSFDWEVSKDSFKNGFYILGLKYTFKK